LTKDQQLLLRQYDTYVDLFKFYVDTAYKFTAWFFVITGAVLSYQMKEKPQPPIAVLVPIAFGLLLGATFLLGAYQAFKMKGELEGMRDGIHLRGAPHVDVLIWYLVGSGITFLVVSITLIRMWCLGKLADPLL